MAKEVNLEEKLENVFSQKKAIKKYLDTTSTDYRYLEPGRLLYIMTMKFGYKDKFSDKFLELAYTTLKAWGMDSQSARLVKFSEFKEKICKSKALFDDLKNKKIEQLYAGKLYVQLHDLFKALKLSETDSQLVTVSKTMHFFLPNLIAPIDRRYTLNFFHKNNQNTFSDIEKQFLVFMKIEEAYSLFSQKHELRAFQDKGWNQNIPKIMDNLVIGYMLEKNA